MADLRHLLAIYVHAHQTGNSVPPHIDAEARTALAAEPPAPAEPDTDAVLALAAIIRRVNGWHSLGAAALAEAILSHPGAAFSVLPPASGPTTDDIWELCEDHEFHLGDGFDGEASAEIMLQIIRVALTRWGRPAPAPAADDEREDREELAQWLDRKGRGAWPCPDGFSAKAEAEEYEMFSGLTRAAALLRQLPPEGLDPASYDAGGLVQIQRANQNPEAWAIRCGVSCMSTAGEWDIEPMPSHRTDEWLANHRWPTVAAAWAALQQARRQEVGDG